MLKEVVQEAGLDFGALQPFKEMDMIEVCMKIRTISLVRKNELEESQETESTRRILGNNFWFFFLK